MTAEKKERDAGPVVDQDFRDCLRVIAARHSLIVELTDTRLLNITRKQKLAIRAEAEYQLAYNDTRWMIARLREVERAS